MVTSPGSKLKEYPPQTWREKAMKFIILSKDPEDSDVASTFVPVLANSRGSLMELAQYDSQWASPRINPKCEDVGSTGGITDLKPWERSNIMDKLGDHSIGPACAANGPWQDACYKDTFFGQLARLYCPQMCSCSQPQKPQVLGDKGCPDACAEPAGAIRLYRTCNDMTMYQLNNSFPEDFQNCATPPCRLSSYWKELVDNFQAATDNYSPLLKQRAVDISSRLRARGCFAVNTLSQKGTDLCSEVSLFPGYQAFRFYCPQACQCSQYRSSHCPDACASTGSTR